MGQIPSIFFSFFIEKSFALVIGEKHIVNSYVHVVSTSDFFWTNIWFYENSFKQACLLLGTCCPNEQCGQWASCDRHVLIVCNIFQILQASLKKTRSLLRRSNVIKWIYKKWEKYEEKMMEKEEMRMTTSIVVKLYHNSNCMLLVCLPVASMFKESQVFMKHRHYTWEILF